MSTLAKIFRVDQAKVFLLVALCAWSPSSVQAENGTHLLEESAAATYRSIGYERERLEESVERVSPTTRRLPVTIEAVAALANEYVWRGRLISDQQTVHPSLTLGFGNTGLAFNAWGAIAVKGREGILTIADPLTEPVKVKSADEANLTLTFDRNFGGARALGLSLGYRHYLYPYATNETYSQELFCGFGLGSPIAPAVTLFYRIRSPKSLYLTAGVYPQFYLDPERTTLVSGRAKVGFSDSDKFGFSDLTVAVTTSVRKGRLSVGPIAEYVISDASSNLSDGKFWGGLEVRFIQ
jgi:hypothetical protein